MKVAISATGDSLGAVVDSRFGRCAWLLLVDSETMEYKACLLYTSDAADDSVLG